MGNTTQQRFDDFVTHRGVQVLDLLKSLGIDITGATGTTAIAPDRFQKSLPVGDVAAGTLTGEGPVRLVVPQAVPGRPDRGSRFSPAPCGDGLDFREDADHNAGSTVRGVIALRIDPMPEGLEEFDFMNGGWACGNSGQFILYGCGVR